MIILPAVTFLLISSFQLGNCEETCQTKSCLETADRVVNSMNETANPCEDFYEFACRGWIRNNPIPKHEMSWSTVKVVKEEIELRLYRILNAPDKEEDGRPIKMARALYRSCMDLESVENVGLKPITDAFTKLGLPIMPPTDEEAANLDIPKIAGSALSHYGVDIFIYVDLYMGSNNTYGLKLESVSPNGAIFDMYLRDLVHHNTIVEKEKTYIRGMIQVAGTKEKSVTYATEIMSFMTEIAKIMATPKEKASKNYTQPEVTIMELQNLTDPDVKHWNWTKYLNAAFEQTDVVVDPMKDTALVKDMGYFKGLPLLLSKNSRGVAARYVWWKVYSQIAPRTLQKFRDYGAHFGKRTGGFDATWHGCTKIVKEFFDNALTAAYVEKHVNEQNRKNASEIWTDVTSSFDEMLTEYTWMDDETKAQAHIKLRAMQPSIGYPEWVTDPQKLEEYYKEYEVIEGSLAQTYTNLKSIERKRLMNSWKQTQDRNTWLISATQVATQSIGWLNTITFGAGFLHEPFYGNAVEALNYGALGAVMGHQVTYGFNSYGQRYDANGTVRKWWSDDALKHYKEQVNCVIKQYSGYEVAQIHKNFTFGGIRTKTENVADIGGLSIAYKAYKKQEARRQSEQVIPGLAKYTNDQLFFLGYAQMRCDSYTNAALKIFMIMGINPPGRIRIIGALQDNAEFAKAWNCPAGSPMNPEKKCNVW